jgi:phage terminase Nu1 subunit (DNA packaging protein)
MSSKITQPQFAALVGVSPRRLRQISQEDDAFPQHNKGYLCEEVGEWIRARERESLGIGDDGSIPDFTAEKAKLTAEQRKLAELNRKEQEGELLRRDDVDRFISSMIVAAKAKLGSARSKLAPILAPSLGEAEVADYLKKIHDEAISEISRKL